jgi:hypothetical protein
MFCILTAGNKNGLRFRAVEIDQIKVAPIDNLGKVRIDFVGCSCPI